MAIASLFGVVALPIVLIGILLPVALVLALQVWLCRRKNRWLGLILPGLSLAVSLLSLLSMLAFRGAVGGSMTVTENGQVVEETVTENGMTTVYDGEGNIPTVVLGGIWLHYKNRRDFQDEMKKMNIQDLE